MCGTVSCIYFTITFPTIQGWTMHKYLYVPAFWNVTVNVFEEPGNSCPLPFGSKRPELTYFSLPVIV